MLSLRQSALALLAVSSLLTLCLGFWTLLSADAGEAQVLMAVAIVLAVAVTFLGLRVYRGLARGLSTVLIDAKAIAAGQLEGRGPRRTNREFEELHAALDEIATRQLQFAQTTGKHAAALAGEAANLAATSAELVHSAGVTNTKATSVAAASEQMSASIEQMAHSTTALSMNFKTVAAAVEQMTASIADVAKNTEHSAAVAKEAEDLAQRSNQGIAALDTAAEEIGKVIQVIEDIAEQTNLLALNATIEAARAGEAGRGFAVVASEVKELARQTAEATSDIQKRIAHIQEASRGAVANMGRIGEAITQVNGAARSIATAVEQQSIATKEIAGNVAQSASSSNAVSEGVSQCAQASQEIARSITDVSVEAQRNAHTAGRLEGSSGTLGQVGAALVEVVRGFRKRADGFDLVGFQAGHIGWKRRLADVLAHKTTIPLQEVADHHQCALGKWYDGEGKKHWGQFVAFRTLHDEHAEFHRLARSIVEAVGRKDLHAASDDYEKLADLSVTVVGRLQQLEDEAAAVAGAAH